MTHPPSTTEREPVTIRGLGRREAHLVGAVIADSHAAYPAFTHLFPDPAQRGRVLRSLMTISASDARRNGTVTVAESGGQLLGAAVWLAPGRFPWSVGRKVMTSAAFVPLWWHARGSASALFELGGNAEAAAPAEPHWSLQVLGVRAGAQGRGLGTRLLQPILARADQNRVICHLHTADPANVAFYRRLGFEVEGPHQLIPGGPPHYSMRRRPVVATSSPSAGDLAAVSLS